MAATLPLGRRLVGLVASTWRLGIVAAVLVLIPSSLLLFDELRESLLGWPAGRIGLLIALTAAAATAGAAIGRVLEGLRHEVFTDVLTGLYNRRFMDAQLDLLDAKAGRYGRNFSVVAFDLDGLKRVNDAYGHEVGDLVICTFAAILRGALRRSDVAIRTGGDEFIAILPETPSADLNVVFERVRSRLAEARARDPRLGVTVSAGAAGWTSGRAVSHLVREADRMLYEAKRYGRDRLEVEPAAA